MDADATISNFYPGLLARLAEELGVQVSPPDLYAYIAAMLAHPAFTARFQKDLKRPGLRVPLTADAKLFAEAVALGREVVWLHCYGERFHDDAAGRPHAPPRLPKERAPTIPKAGAIPTSKEDYPNDIDYDAGLQRLIIGKGYVENVSPAVWAYEVSGKQVLRQWFSYRKRDRTRPQIGDKRPPSPLTLIQPEGWLAEYTTDLLNLLHVLGRLVDLEPAQAALLDNVCNGYLISHDTLLAAGVIAPDPDSNTTEETGE